ITRSLTRAAALLATKLLVLKKTTKDWHLLIGTGLRLGLEELMCFGVFCDGLGFRVLDRRLFDN
ncbi:hypothetical protein, partial [Aliirhizobium cellulosilyticum]|uniref:hypothetical protein n=1 Tax=Aliirhizobium cellulosilyticum TaxID=393664 RepID=UPI001AEDA55C